ncbi:MAG: hypothetical protein B6U88_01275 [Candidatus Aenigmarchaeota archaeon ex4484_56]|nr:MAG: hypothetical protein B6U88_01275 [Candidatus Aenigmarchaeota archaeon ex4484_56]
MIEPIIITAISSCFILIYYYIFLKKKQTEKAFTIFLQDIYNNTQSGMPIIQAIKKSSENKYKSISDIIQSLKTQLDWDIPLPIIIKRLAKKSNNKFISKMLILLEKASEYSPNMKESMKEINKYIMLKQELEKERRYEIYPQIISLYLVFFVFIGVIISLFMVFFPSVNINIGIIKTMQHLVYIEAILSGFTIGKIVDNDFISSMKHSAILLFISTIIFYLI